MAAEIVRGVIEMLASMLQRGNGVANFRVRFGSRRGRRGRSGCGLGVAGAAGAAAGKTSANANAKDRNE